MHHNRYVRHVTSVCLLIGAAAYSRAQTDGRAPDPVAELRQALQATLEDPSANSPDIRARQETLSQRVQALRGIRDLRRALELGDWRDNELDPQVSSVDREAREEVVKRLLGDLRGYLARPDTQLAAADIVAELGSGIRETYGTGGRFPKGITSQLAPDLVRLTESGSPAVRTAAARALSAIDPGPELAAPALGALLRSDDAALRQVAATALRDLLQREVQLLSKGQTPSGVQSSWAEVLETGAAVVPQAANGLSDPDRTVRRSCAETLQTAAFALYDYLFEPLRTARTPAVTDTLQPGLPARAAEGGRRQAGTEQAGLTGLSQALANQRSTLARALGDADPEIRLRATRTLENMADARRRLLGQGTVRPPVPRMREPLPPAREVRPTAYFEVDLDADIEQGPGSPADEALQRGLRDDLARLAAGVNDPSVDVRRATVGTLEFMGMDAAPAAPALVQALGDPDKFVRWGAARTLGRLRIEEGTAVPAIARLLNDRDLDVRQVAAGALERYGPAARAAVPALARTVAEANPDVRVAALRALIGIGPDSQAAIPAMVVALNHPTAYVRAAAAQAIASLGPRARSAEGALRQALLDPDALVRASAGEALLSVLQPARER
jgi:HEAT repeat protein